MSKGYALGQLAGAFVTATTHEDPAVRERADLRAQRWMQALERIDSGEVVVGSRTPTDLPAWVTLEVLHGGFATGNPLAGGPLDSDEIALATRLGVARRRRLLFAHFLTEEGLAELQDLLDSGSYRIDLPEDAALLTVAWLLRHGDRETAFDLLEQIEPYADQLRFMPRAAALPSLPADHVFRESAGQARQALAGRSEQARVEAQRETLTVWNPFADRMLALWWERFTDGALTRPATADWLTTARHLVSEYDALAAQHTRTKRHRNPKHNLAILVRTARTETDRGALDPRQAGLLTAAVRGMVAKRGEPDSTQLADLRDEQRKVALSPAHRDLAALAARRLDHLPPESGLVNPLAYAARVTPGEATTHIPAATTMPTVVSRVLARTYAAPIEKLLAARVVPSSEVLSGLLPGISATVVAATYPDDALARLMAANYRAFRNRRSLLLLDLAKQVQIGELPWVRATEKYRSEAVDEALAVTRRVGALALDHFPATILPNPLVRELDQLLRLADHDLPLTEELAADIFMGHFSDKFRRAAQIAAPVIADSLYAAYYDIDTDQILDLPTPPKSPPRQHGWPWRPTPQASAEITFSTIATNRAGGGHDRWSVAANGMVIEQAQILTTHNLAALISTGVQPHRSWTELADTCWHTTMSLLWLAATQTRPLPTVKDAAYAWRQMIFFLSQATQDQQATFLAAKTASHPNQPPATALLLGGLRRIAVGGRFEADGRCIGGRRFTAWTLEGPWVLDVAPTWPPGSSGPPPTGPDSKA